MVISGILTADGRVLASLKYTETSRYLIIKMSTLWLLAVNKRGALRLEKKLGS